jgi:hypothetical protein
MTNKFKCFNSENSKINYINYFYEILINPTYLSNISIILGIVFLLLKNYSLIQAFMPLLITNGLSILFYKLKLNKTVFEPHNFKYMCNNNNKDQELIFSLFNKNKSERKSFIISIVIHFWLPILIFILGKNNTILRDRKQSNIVASLLINCIILSLYGIFMRKDQYIIFDMDEKKVSNFIFCIYIPILLLVTYLYFTL